MPFAIYATGFVLAFMAAVPRGRSWAWSLLSWAGLIAVLVLPNKAPNYEKITPNTHVRCPDCKEPVRKDATKCKHCGCELIPQ